MVRRTGMLNLCFLHDLGRGAKYTFMMFIFNRLTYILFRIGYIPVGLMNNPLIPVVQQPAAANHRSHNIIMVRVTLHGKHHNGAVH